MCLTLDSSNIAPELPIKEGNIRWKVLDLHPLYYRLESPYFGSCVWNLNVWKTARNYNSLNTRRQDIGFHVFLTKKDAVYYAQPRQVIVKVEVEQHNYSGLALINKKLKTETWKRARVLEVYTSSGRYNITKRFK